MKKYEIFLKLNIHKLVNAHYFEYDPDAETFDFYLEDDEKGDVLIYSILRSEIVSIEVIQ